MMIQTGQNRRAGRRPQRRISGMRRTDDDNPACNAKIGSAGSAPGCMIKGNVLK